MRKRVAASIASVLVLVLLMIGRGAAAKSGTGSAVAVAARPGLVALRVPSSSMFPTIQAGATIIVDLRAYVGKRPRIGDIVVFHPPRGAEPLTPVCGNRNQGAGHSQVCGAPTPQMSKQKFLERVVGCMGTGFRS
jgi:signal peptidase I